MTELRERAQELVHDIMPFCRQRFPDLFWEEFIITFKQSEIVAWSFHCLTCDNHQCPLIPTKMRLTLTKPSKCEGH